MFSLRFGHFSRILSVPAIQKSSFSFKNGGHDKTVIDYPYSSMRFFLLLIK